MTPDIFPIRKTTRLALEAALQQHARNLNAVALAAKDDGEAPDGYILDADNYVWKKIPVTSPRQVETQPLSEN